MSFRFTTTVARCTWPDMPSIYFLSATSQSSDAQEVGVVRQQVRDLESCLHEKEEALFSSLHC
jgi:hypothetical protein